jgi:hypothetical protein
MRVGRCSARRKRAKIQVTLGVHGRVLLEPGQAKKLLHRHQCQCGVEVGLATGCNSFIPQAHETHARRHVQPWFSQPAQALHHHRISLMVRQQMLQCEIGPSRLLHVL